MSEQEKSRIASLQDDQDADISALYRQSAQELPPVALDDQILSAAHAAVTPQQAATITPKPRRSWSLLGGLAAGVLVTVVAVKSLPYSLRSPIPAKQQPGLSEGRHADSLSPKGAAPFVSEDYETSDPAARPEKHLLTDQTSVSRGPQQSRALERAASKPELQEHIEAEQANTTQQSNETDSALMIARDKEFLNIVMLWNIGDIPAALKRFQIFQEAYPGYLPHPRYQDTLQALRSALSATIQTE